MVNQKVFYNRRRTLLAFLTALVARVSKEGSRAVLQLPRQSRSRKLHGLSDVHDRLFSQNQVPFSSLPLKKTSAVLPVGAGDATLPQTSVPPPRPPQATDPAKTGSDLLRQFKGGIPRLPKGSYRKTNANDSLDAIGFTLSAILTTKSPSAKSKNAKKCKGKAERSKSKGLSKAPSTSKAPDYYCPPTYSPYPTSSPPPTSEEDLILRSKCEAIKSGNGPLVGPSKSLTVDFLLILNGEVDSTLQNLEDFMQRVVALDLVGCMTERTNDRMTEESTNITNAVFDVYEDSDMPPCSTDIPETTCHHVNADARLFFDYDSDLSSYSSTALYLFLLRFCEDFKNIAGIERTFDPCSAMDVAVNPGDTTGGDGGGGTATDDAEGDGGGTGTDDAEGGGSSSGAAAAAKAGPAQTVTMGALVGVAIAALFVILVVVLVARRKQKHSYPLKHHQLDEYDDETYLKDDYDSPRRSHLVNNLSDDDSLFSGLSGFPQKKGEEGAIEVVAKTRQSVDAPASILANRKGNHDVHVCNSATCEACEEQRRQVGLQFVPSIMPAHSYDPKSRSYVARDTVQL